MNWGKIDGEEEEEWGWGRKVSRNYEKAGWKDNKSICILREVQKIKK